MLGDRAQLSTFRDMLVAVRDRIQSMVTAGKTQQEVVAAKPTQPFDDKWGKGFLTPDGFVEIVYSDLSKRKASR